MQEIFDYSTYDAPQIVREVIGFGQPLDYFARCCCRRCPP